MSRAVVVATGVTRAGDLEVLGVEVGDSEDGAFWTSFLRGLRARGLTGVQLVISDHHLGLKAAIAGVFLGSTWQRCRVHFMRNVLARVPKASGEMVAAAVRTVFAQPTPPTSAANWSRWPTFRGQFPDVAAMLTDSAEDILAFTGFPQAHWRKVWSTNPLERLNGEIKRRTNVVGIFPNDASVLRLITAVVPDPGLGWTSDRHRRESVRLLRHHRPPPGSLLGHELPQRRVGPALAVDPTNPSNMLGTWQQDRWSSGGSRGVLAGVSRDGGGTWTPSIPHFSVCAGGTKANGGYFERSSYPAVAFAPDGDSYVMAPAFNLMSDPRSAMLVAKSADGGAPGASRPQLVNDPASSGVHHGVSSIVTDPYDSNYVYALWQRSRFPSGSAPSEGEHRVGGPSGAPFRSDVMFSAPPTAAGRGSLPGPSTSPRPSREPSWGTTR